MKTKSKVQPKMPQLPEGLLPLDLQRVEYDEKKSYDKQDRNWDLNFSLWYIEEYGWVITTLQISGARSNHQQERTYAVSMEGKVVRVGHGPHVLHMVEVHGRNSRAKVLQPFIDLRQKGLADAGTIRDRISTRRANTALRRFDDRFRW